MNASRRTVSRLVSRLVGRRGSPRRESRAGWAELGRHLLVPGWSMRRERPVIAGVLGILGVVVPLAVALGVLLTGRTWFALVLDGRFLAVAEIVAAAAILARVLAIAIAGHRPDARSWRVPATVAAVAVAMGGSVAVARVDAARREVAPVFAGRAAGPLYVPGSVGTPGAGRPTIAVPNAATAATTAATMITSATSMPDPSPTVRGDAADALVPSRSVIATTTTTTLPPLPSAPDADVDPAVVADVTVTLLIGGDAGPGRSGLRTDTMMLFCLHRPSGRAALVSLPRDLRGMLVPPDTPLGRRFPYGFTERVNAIYPYVSSRPELRDAYRRDDIRPGVVALAEAIGYSLDVPIDDYVLIDMEGFIEVIDALGGVTVEVRREIPMPGNVPGAPTQYPDTIGPGVITMDGSTALGYVRSRYADSDFQRTERQRRLLAALARQVSLVDVLGSFGDVTGAVSGTLRTSLSPDELGETVAVIGGETAIVESVGLVPPLIDIDSPDFARMAQVVADVRVAIATGQPSGW